MKLGVYSLITPDYNIEETAALLAEIGYEGVEWAVDYPKAVWDGRSNWHISSDDLEGTTAAVRAACEQHGLTVVCLGTRCNCFEAERVAAYMKVAKMVGAPAIRVMAPGYDPETAFADQLARARDAYAQIEEIARGSGVKAMLELHNGLICSSASGTMRVLEGCDPEFIGAIFDPGNMIREGMEHWKLGADALGPFLQHVHVKSGMWLRGEGGKWVAEAAGLAEGMIDWPFVIESLKAVGYDGYLHLEDLRGGWACKPVGFTTRGKLQEAYDYLKPLL